LAHISRRLSKVNRGRRRPEQAFAFFFGETMTDYFVAIVDEFSQKFLDGKLPDKSLDAELIARFLVHVPADTPPELIEIIAAGLVRAVDCLRRSRETSWPN
jgi:hypothetical protein